MKGSSALVSPPQFLTLAQGYPTSFVTDRFLVSQQKGANTSDLLKSSLYC